MRGQETWEVEKRICFEDPHFLQSKKINNEKRNVATSRLSASLLLRQTSSWYFFFKNHSNHLICYSASFFSSNIIQVSKAVMVIIQLVGGGGLLLPPSHLALLQNFLCNFNLKKTVNNQVYCFIFYVSFNEKKRMGTLTTPRVRSL